MLYLKKKQKKNTRIYRFTPVYQKSWWYDLVPEIWSMMDFCPLTNLKTWKIKILKKKKKMLEVLIIFKNRPPICDRPPTYICWDKFWSMSSTDKFMILWKSQEKMISIDVSPIYRGYVEIEKNKVKWRLIHGG